jgi:predicted CXXCH cytochrome family protein
MSYLIILRTGTNDRQETRAESGPRLLIGRGPQSQLRLDHDAIAVEHARVDQTEDGRYVLTDLGSPAGSYVNGKRIEKAQLAAGDQIAIGPYLLKVELLQQHQGPLILDVRQIRASAERGEPVRTDFAAAYGLNRRLFSKTILTWLCTGAGIIVITGILFAGRTQVFQPGALSDPHSFFNQECFRCHVAWHGPSEAACQKCHAAPLHHKNQTFTPPCLSCHAEHREQSVLADVTSQYCVQCHADLKTKGSQTAESRYQKKITDFSRDHPEFAIAVAGVERRVRLSEKAARRSDLATIKLNHQVHLKRGLKGPNGTVRLTCQSCHRPALDGLLMAPVTYVAHCKDCHELGFDDQYPDRRVPHGSTELTRAYLLRVYSELTDQMVRYPEIVRGFPLSATAEKLDPSIIRKVRQAESHLYSVVCNECHELELKEGSLPEVVKTGIPVIWYRHVRFSHKAHRIVECESCHKGVDQSKETKDVLLPGIERCRDCHRHEGLAFSSQKSRALTNCAACHTYHDRSRGRWWVGPFAGAGTLDPVKPESTKGATERPQSGREEMPSGSGEKSRQ